jgi:hypothetical protein
MDREDPFHWQLLHNFPLRSSRRNGKNCRHLFSWDYLLEIQLLGQYCVAEHEVERKMILIVEDKEVPLHLVEKHHLLLLSVSLETT